MANNNGLQKAHFKIWAILAKIIKIKEKNP